VSGQAEIALAGHDGCIVPIKPEKSTPGSIPTRLIWAAQSAILDDRHQPYYGCRLQA
jgi:hypothetical protein